MSLHSKKFIQSLARETGASPEDAEVFEFGLILLINGLIDIAVIFTIAYCLGFFQNVVIAYTVAAVLKYFAGGTHARTMSNCLIIGTVAYTSIGLVSQVLPGDSPLMLSVSFGFVAGLSLVSFLRYAPNSPPQKPVRSVRHYGQLRRGSLIVLSIILLVGVSWLLRPFAPAELFWAGCLALVWQSFILLPCSKRLFNLIERHLC